MPTFISPELGFLLFLALLWGPTALWLIVRAARGPRSRAEGTFDTTLRSAASTQALAEVAPDDAVFWICAACRSVNRPQAGRCYSCRARKGAPPLVAADGPAGSPGVPVMAQDVARSAAMPLAVTGVSATTGPAPAAIPIVAEPVAVGPGRGPATVPAGLGPAAPAAASATPPAAAGRPASGERVATPVLAGAVAAPAVAAAAAATAIPAASAAAAPTAPTWAGPGATPVSSACPYLGLRADRATRFDFPDDQHACHAGSGTPIGQSQPSRGEKRRTGNAPAIAIDHQAAYCLSGAYPRCPRYRPAER